MIKKINSLISKKQKILISIIFISNFVVMAFEFLSLGSIPLIISFIINNNFINSESDIINFLDNFITFKEIDLNSLFILIFFLFLIKNLFLGLVIYLESIFSLSIRKNLSIRLFKKYLNFPYLFHLNNNPGKLIRNLVDEVQNCCGFFSYSLVILRDILLIIIITSLLFIFNKTIVFPIILLFGIIVFFIFKKLKKDLRKKGKDSQEQRGLINIRISELINGIKEIKILGSYKDVISKFAKSISQNEYNLYVLRILNSFPKIILELISVSLIVLLFFSYRILNIEISNFIPILSLVVVATIRLMPSISSLIISTNNILFQYESLNIVYKHLFLEKNENITNNTFTNYQFNKNIELKNIYFKYPGRKEFALKNVSLTIKKGSKVGIIGNSGSGKTTLLNIILGLIKPFKGKVLIDGQHVKNFSYHFWKNKIGYVSQNTFLIDDNIKRNIIYSNHKIHQGKFKKTLEITNLTNFIKSLPKKEQTFIGNNGIKLSGGQHQRIGIARALYNQPDVLVMDEATSSLDFRTEKNIINDLKLDKKTDLTSIIITHRPLPVENCDCIYLLAKGKIKDKGNFKKLSYKYNIFQLRKN